VNEVRKPFLLRKWGIGSDMVPRKGKLVKGSIMRESK
jgi:hypothetical protein